MYTTIVGAAAGALVAPLVIANISSPVLGAILGGAIANRWKVIKTCSEESDKTTQHIDSIPIERVQAAAVGMIGLGSMISIYGLLSSTQPFTKTALKIASLISASTSEQYAIPIVGGALIGAGLLALLIGKGGIIQKENPLKRSVVWGAVGGILVGALTNVEAPPCTVAAIWALTFGLMGLNSGIVDSFTNLNFREHRATITMLFGLSAILSTITSSLLDGRDFVIGLKTRCAVNFFSAIFGFTFGTFLDSMIETPRDEYQASSTKKSFLGMTTAAAAVFGLIGGNLTIAYTNMRFPGPIRTIGVLTCGLLAGASNINMLLEGRPLTPTTTKNFKDYQETARMLLGGVLPLLIYDQVIPYQEENRAINIVASSILFPMGALIAKGFVGKLALKVYTTIGIALNS